MGFTTLWASSLEHRATVQPTGGKTSTQFTTTLSSSTLLRTVSRLLLVTPTFRSASTRAAISRSTTIPDLTAETVRHTLLQAPLRRAARAVRSLTVLTGRGHHREIVVRLWALAKEYRLSGLLLGSRTTQMSRLPPQYHQRTRRVRHRTQRICTASWRLRRSSNTTRAAPSFSTFRFKPFIARISRHLVA